MDLPSTQVADSAEADFLEYRRSGDPAALARVFDQVAPELLLLAAHLVGGGRERADDAEDLLQSTFVAAIESAARYEASRPLRAWLVGILVHMAQRERRRRLRVPDPSRLPPEDTVDPERLAEDAEFAERFQRALAALPQPYRNVLTLRLVHGLRPLAIAHAHGTAPATVRSQLRRGLEILRQALPAGFAVASLLVVARGQGLAAVRAAVVEHAERLAVGTAAKGMAAAAGATALAGARFSVVLALVIAGLAAVAVGWWLWDLPATPPAMGAAAPSDVITHEPVAPPAGTAGAQRMQARPTPSAAAGAGLLVVVRHAGDGSPAAGVAILVMQAQVTDPTLTERRLVTDPGGAAHAEGLAAGVYMVLPDRAPLAYVTVPAQGLVTHRVELPPGVDVQGKVVDLSGQPVAGAAVFLADGRILDESQEAATSDAAGLFSLRGVEPGRSLSAIAPGYRPTALRRLPEVPGPARIKLVLDEAGVAVRGCVFDPHGAPVARARVMLGRVRSDTASSDVHEAARRPPLWLWTAADGRFETTSASFEDGPLPLWVRAPGCQLWTRRLQAVDMGTELRVELQPGAGIRGVVRSPEGLPVGGTHVRAVDPRVLEQDRQTAPSWASPRCVVDAQGAYALVGVPEGTVDVVAHQDPVRCAFGRVATRGAEPAELDLVLGRPSRIHGRLTDPLQAPVAGFEVQVVPRPGLPRLDLVVTDASGCFAVTGCLPSPYTVEVWDPASAWRRPVQSWFDVVPGEAPLALELLPHRRASVFVRGRFLDERGNPASLSVVLARSGMDGVLARTDPETGRYVLGPVPPGQYSVQARRGGGVLAVSGPVQLGENATHEFEPQRLVRPGRVLLRPPRAPTPQGEGQVHVCTEAGFTLTGWVVARDMVPVELPPGDYTMVWCGAWARRMVRVAVRSGEDTELALAPEAGARQAVRILAALTPLELRITDLDAGGNARFVQVLDVEPTSAPPRLGPLLPRGRWRLVVTDARGHTGAATVTVEDPARALPEIELRLQ